jgi:IS4 transposase
MNEEDNIKINIFLKTRKGLIFVARSTMINSCLVKSDSLGQVKSAFVHLTLHDWFIETPCFG